MSSKGWERFEFNEQFDGTRALRGPSNEASAFESEHHLMNGGRGDVEIALKVGFCGRSTDNFGVGMNER